MWQRNTYFTTIIMTLIINFKSGRISHKSMFINLFIVIIILIMGQAYSVNFSIFITINILLYQCWQRVVLFKTNKNTIIYGNIIISNISDVGYISWNNTSLLGLSVCINLTYSLLRVGAREGNTMNRTLTLTLCIMRTNCFYILCK